MERLTIKRLKENVNCFGKIRQHFFLYYPRKNIYNEILPDFSNTIPFAKSIDFSHLKTINKLTIKTLSIPQTSQFFLLQQLINFPTSTFCLHTHTLFTHIIHLCKDINALHTFIFSYTHTHTKFVVFIFRLPFASLSSWSLSRFVFVLSYFPFIFVVEGKRWECCLHTYTQDQTILI